MAPYAGVIVSMALIVAAGLLYWIVVGGRPHNDYRDHQNQVDSLSTSLTGDRSGRTRQSEALSRLDDEPWNHAEQPLLSWKRESPTKAESAWETTGDRNDVQSHPADSSRSAPTSTSGMAVFDQSREAKQGHRAADLEFPQSANPHPLNFSVLGLEDHPTDPAVAPRGLPEVSLKSTPHPLKPIVR